MSVELRPRWGGFLSIDGKAIFIKGKQHCLLIGVDHPTQDLVHALVLEAETAEGFARLETEAPRRRLSALRRRFRLRSGLRADTS